MRVTRLTHAQLRAQGRAAERADVLAALATIRAGLPEMIRAGKLDADGASILDRRLDTLAEQIAGGLHEREGGAP
jgi:hypothetical protein